MSDGEVSAPKKVVIGYKYDKSKKKGCKPLPVKIFTEKERIELAKTMDLRIIKKKKRIKIP